MLNKRGSHVGVVLSFTVFIVFLVFLYSVIEPTIKIDKSRQAVLDFLKDKLIDDLSADYTIVTLSINDSLIENGDLDDEECVSIEQIPGTNGLNFIVKDDGNNPVNSNLNSGKLEIDITQNSEFFKIYYSEEEFSQQSPSPGNCLGLSEEDNDYNLLVRTRNDIIMTKVSELLVGYQNDYGSLKNDLGVTPGVEFGFTMKYEDDSEDSTNDNPPETTNVYVEEVPVQYVDSEANIKSGFINIRVW